MGDDDKKKKKGSDDCGIKVCVRVRPWIYPRDNGASLCLTMPTSTTVEIKDEQGIPKLWEYDRAYWTHDKRPGVEFADQLFVYKEMGVGLLNNCFAGFNNTLFAYGQTGSGKTYSVLGNITDPEPTGQAGLLPRVVKGLFEALGEMEASGESQGYKCLVSFMEIYNEALGDLLAGAPAGSGKPLDIKQHPVLGVHVPGLTEAAVSDAGAVMELIEVGNKTRTVAATAMNAASSRSHCVFTIKLTLERKDEMGMPITQRSQTHLVDLAGSERAKRTKAEGNQLKEGAAINKSLSTLALVISSLADAAEGKKGNMPPFRDSKLTYILKDALSGNSKTVMMTALSPALADYEETTSTLQFAKSVKKIKTSATANSGAGASDEMMVNMLQAEIDKMKGELEAAMKKKKEGGGAPPPPKSADGSNDGSANGDGEEEDADFEDYSEEELEALKQQLRENEELCEQFGVSAEELLNKEKVNSVKRKSQLERCGVMTNTEIRYRRETANRFTPYLVNMSNDPLLSGNLMYFLPENEKTSFGCDPGCTIALKGVGIWPFMCEIENINHQDLRVSTTVPEAFVETMQEKARSTIAQRRVAVNGYGVVEGTMTALHHADRVMIGRSYTFRLVNPLAIQEAKQENQSGEKAGSDDESGDEDDDPDKQFATVGAVSATNDGELMDFRESMQDVQSFIEDLSMRVGAMRSTAFLAQLRRLTPLVREANEITEEIRPRDRLTFSLLVIFDLNAYQSAVPEAVVQLSRRKRGKEFWRCVTRQKLLDKNSKFHKLMCELMNIQDRHSYSDVLLTLHASEFRSRLDRMRDCAADFMVSGDTALQFLKKNPFEDPWCVLDNEEMVGLQMKLDQMKEEKKSQQSAMSNESQEKQKDLSRANELLEEKDEAEKLLDKTQKELAGKNQAIERLRNEIKWLKNELSVDEDEHDDMRVAIEKMRREIEQEKEQQKYLEEELAGGGAQVELTERKDSDKFLSQSRLPHSTQVAKGPKAVWGAAPPSEKITAFYEGARGDIDNLNKIISEAQKCCTMLERSRHQSMEHGY